MKRNHVLKSKMFANHLLVAVLSVLNAVSGTTQQISLVWWIKSFTNDATGVYPILIMSSIVYVLFYGVSLLYLWLRFYRGKRIYFSELCGLSGSGKGFFSSPFFTVIGIGFNNAANGFLIVMAAPSDRTPPIYGAILGCSTIIYSLFLSKYYLRETRSFGREAYIAVLLSLTSIYMSILPQLTNSGNPGSDEPTKQVLFWSGMTLVAFLPGALYNAQQKKFVLLSARVIEKMCRALHEDSDVLTDYNQDSYAYWAQVHFNVFTLFLGCVFQLLFMFSFFWVMLINAPTLNWNGVHLNELGTNLKNGFECFFGVQSCGHYSLFYGLLFNAAYIMTYTCSIYLNLINLPLSMISSQVQGPLTAITYMVFPSLNLNNTGNNPYGIVPSLFLMCSALVVYELYRKDNEGQELQMLYEYGAVEINSGLNTTASSGLTMGNKVSTPSFYD